MIEITEDILEGLKERIDQEVEKLLKAFHGRHKIKQAYDEWVKSLDRGLYPDDPDALFSLFYLDKAILHVRKGENPLFIKFIEPQGGNLDAEEA